MGKRQPNPIDPDVVRQFFEYEDGALKWKIKKGRTNVGDFPQQAGFPTDVLWPTEPGNV